ncbi:MAG: OmpA family protein [Myxococcales bacterium]|nr:OmpA family protein [Myxococcales bacterium]
MSPGPRFSVPGEDLPPFVGWALTAIGVASALGASSEWRRPHPTTSSAPPIVAPLPQVSAALPRPEPAPPVVAPAAEAPKSRSTCAPVVVTFARGSGWPDRTMEPRLRALGAWAAAHPEVSLVVDGHADTSGSEETNLKLSRERAYAVRSILEKEKVPRARVTTRSFGSFWPADEAPPDASWNRRVVVVTKGETCPPEEITRP